MLRRAGMPLSAVYSASKFALEGLLEGGWRFELAPTGVQICNVCPGRHRTNFMKNISWGQKSKDEN